MNYTENLSLGLPEYGESADVAALNRNSGILDAYVYNTRQMECEPYDSTKTYMSGDLAIHNEVIYECNTDNTTGTWDDSKWDSTNLAEQIAKAKQSGGGQVTKEASGNPIELTDAASAPMVKCVTEIQGSQDLHGYDKPWVGGAGKNKLPMTVSGIKALNTSGTWSGNTYTVNGLTFSIITDNGGNVTGIKVNGTANAVTYFPVASNLTSLGTFDGTYVVNGGINGGSETTFALQVYSNVTNVFINAYNANDWEIVSETTPTANISSAYITIRNGYTANNLLFKPMIRLSTVADSTFAPYSNICPITAYTEGEIEVSDGDGNTTTHTTTFPSAIYRGSEDVVKGTVECVKKKITISSGIQLYGNYGVDNAPLYYYDTTSDIAPYYNSLNPIENRLISNCYNATTGIDEGRLGDFEFRTNANSIGSANRFYFRDSRYTTVADFNAWIANNPIEIVYSVYVPTTSSVTPTNLPIRTLSGYNHIESSTGDMEIEYITEGYQPIVDLIQSSKHVYSTQEQIVGTWIDGSTLYEKTFYKSSVSSASSSTILIPASELGSINVVGMDGRYIIGGNNMPININLNGTSIIATWLAGGNVYYWLIWGSVTSGDVYLTIRYTKPTQTRSLSASLNTQKAQIEPLTDKTEETPTEEEKAVNEEENNDER